MTTAPIPSYDLTRGDSLAVPVRVLHLECTEGSGGEYNASEPHRHNYHEVFYFEKGGGWHDIDFRRYPIEDNALHFVNPGQVHLVRRDPDSHGFIILFTSEFYLRDLRAHDRFTPMWFLTHGSALPIVQPAPDERELFFDTMRRIEAECDGAGPHRERLLHSYLDIFLLHALRLFDRSENARAVEDTVHTLVTRLRTLIEENFTTVHAPRAYAEMLHVSQNHLNSTVRKILGRTIGDLVHERIILEAQRLLFHTDMSVKEIAVQLNYDDPSYFTRFFRRHVGTAPHEFRETARESHR